jgi:RNA polymerase sigma-70 factor (ECF subfamily)
MESRSNSEREIDELLAHEEFVRRLARRLCAADAHGAEDLAQDVWLAALERSPRGEGGWAAWLATVARNLLASRLRRRSSAPDPRDTGRDAAEDHSELERAEVAEARNAVAQAVQRLRDPYRAVVLLRFYDGLELQAIARRCDRPLETVRTQLRRALAQLRAELSDERGTRDGMQMVLLAAMPERERPIAAALGGWSVATVATAAAVLLVGLGWLAVTRFGDESGVALAHAARESPSIPAPADLVQSPAEPRERAAIPALLEAGASEPDVSAGEDGPSLAIEVVDPGGKPVPGARIRVRTGSSWEERAGTDARGLARLALRSEDLGAGEMPPGAAWLSVSADGHATVEEVMVDVTLERDLPLRLGVGNVPGALRARVLDPDGYAIDAADVVFIPAGLPSGVRENGATRRVARSTASTDSEGRVTIEQLPVGDGWVHVRHPDFGIASVALAIAPDPSAERELRIEPGAIVHGVLVDESGAPRAGVRLNSLWRTPFSLPLEWTSTVSAADGSYELTVPAQPNVEVWAIDAQDRGLQIWRFFDPASGERVEWNGALARWDPVRVRLVEPDGAPLANWQVGLRFPTGSLLETTASTDGEGRTQLILPARTGFNVEVHGPVLSAGSVPLHSATGVLPEAALEHTIVVDGRRRDLGGLTARLNPIGWTPAADLQVVVVREGNESSASAPLDRERRFRAVGLNPGRYSIALSSGVRLLGFIAHEQVDSGRTLDLGTLDVPGPAELDLAQVGSGKSFELLAAYPEGGLRSCGSVKGGSSSAALLLPGAFVLRELDPGRPGQPALETRLEATSGRRLILRPDLALQD